MDAADIVFWLCPAVNAVIAVVLIVRFRTWVTAGAVSERKAKTLYSWLCLGIGAFCGTALFLGITSLIDVSRGHGEAIIAAPMLNLALALALIVCGRIVIGWSPIRW